MASYVQIRSRITKLEKEAQQILRKEAVKAIDVIKKMMNRYQITLEDLGSKGASKGDSIATSYGPGRKPQATVRVRNMQKQAAKYRNPKTGEMWSGRGRRPGWIIDAFEKGKQDKFLIDGGVETKTVKAVSGKTASADVGGKTQSALKADARAKKASQLTEALSPQATAKKRGRKPGRKSAQTTGLHGIAQEPLPQEGESAASVAVH